jgi:GT2 family glycosyltransferase
MTREEFRKMIENFLKQRGTKNRLSVLIRPIFDADWYKLINKDVSQQVEVNKTTALKHYLEHGIKEGRSPNALFSFHYYKENNKEHLSKKLTDNVQLMVDFLTNPQSFGNSPHALFDPRWYWSQNEEIHKAFAEKKLHPYLHFIEHGAKEGRAPNSMFDAHWYLQNYPEANDLVKDGAMTAIQHYLLIGGRRGFSPSPSFDARWYLEQNQDVAALTREGLTDALSHYIARGRAENRPYRAHGNSAKIRNLIVAGPVATRKGYDSAHHRVRRHYSLSKAPLVSIIIVNLNGERHLNDLGNSLIEQSYRNFEIIFVDNGSEDNSCKIWRARFPSSTIIALPYNVGFAEANNIGLRHSRGELIALLNNDTKADPDWLYSLVNAIRYDPDIGAATSKIRFWTPFITIEISSEAEFFARTDDILSCLKYKKYFADVGNENNGRISAVKRGNKYEICVKIPADNHHFNIPLMSVSKQQLVEVKCGHRRKMIKIDSSGQEITFPISEQSAALGKYVINNAGSIEGPNHTTADRGFGAYDESQFETVEPVSLLCGCACLIRRDALVGRDIFIGEFFAYYEDSELSQRLRHSGFRIIYCPASKVYHKHSSTSVEKSTFWMKYVNRNQILYQYILSSTEDRKTLLREKLLTLNHHKVYFSDKENIKTADDITYAGVLDDIISELPQLVDKFEDGDLPGKNQIRIGVYNNFWQTLGGGEAHALSVVSALRNISSVEMISCVDFDIDYILSYFGLDRRKIRKRIVLDMVPELTAEYDIFVNSTYMSELKSLAPSSFYLVSFPSKTPTVEFLNSYKFLANSEYTSDWMEKMWGKGNYCSEILYPAVSDKIVESVDGRKFKKLKQIISVGRFFESGHSKNQHIIAEIFKLCVNSGGFDDWQLVLIGSSNDDWYVHRVMKILSGYNAKVLTDLPLEKLKEYYRSASIYIHAAGFGHDMDKEPENFEHFGMTVVEAAMNGCLPIVYNQAGPREIVKKLEMGCTYDTIEEAANVLGQKIAELESADTRNDLAFKLSSKASSLFHTSSSESRNNKILSIFGLNKLQNPQDSAIYSEP